MQVIPHALYFTHMYFTSQNELFPVIVVYEYKSVEETSYHTWYQHCFYIHCLFLNFYDWGQIDRSHGFFVGVSSIHHHKLISDSNGKHLLPLDWNPRPLWLWQHHLPGEVTTTRVWGSNPEQAGVSHVCPPEESNNMKAISITWDVTWKPMWLMWCEPYSEKPY